MQQQQQQQASRTSSSPVSSCKFGIDSASSPQDLSTSSGGAGQSPEPRSSSPRVQGNSNQNSSQQSSNAGSVNSQSKGGNFGSNSSSNPPHIYPWMRKVHVGQSKPFEKPFAHLLIDLRSLLAHTLAMMTIRLYK